MFNLLRYLRHSSVFKKIFPWEILGKVYRFLIRILPFDFTINQFVTKNNKFKLHARFAFSNFKEWGNKHNNFFPVYLRLSKQSKCFFDVGAHIGIVSLSVSKNINKNGLIYAFEPSKINLKLLKYHISSNKLKNIKVIEKMIISTKKKKSVIYESNEASGMNSIVEIDSKNITNKRYIPSITLDEFCRDKKLSPDIIKVDIEGSEIEMLIGAKNIIKKHKPIIFLSYHPFHLKKLGYKNSLIFEILKQLNYKIYDSSKNEPLNLKNSEYLLAHKKRHVDDIF
jgi:FkbM family methyltransferase